MRLIPLVFPLACLASVRAQTSSFVLPRGFATMQDRQYDLWLAAGSRELPVRVQYLYATADLPAGAMMLREVAFRLWSAWPNSNSTLPTAQTLSLDLSHGAQPPRQRSMVFAANHGVDRKQVFQGTVNWPGGQAAMTATPEPFLFAIKFSNPFPLLASQGASVVCDFRVTMRPPFPLSLDAAGRPDGDVLGFLGHPMCVMSNSYPAGKYLRTWLSGLTNRGGSWSFGHDNMLLGTGAFTLSSYCSLFRPGNWPLPIDLTPLGMTGCQWHLGLETGIWIPFLPTTAAGYLGSPVITIPPGLGGVTFFTQGVFFETATVVPPVSTTANGWVVGTGVTPDVAMVAIVNDVANATTGTIGTTTAIVMQGVY